MEQVCLLSRTWPGEFFIVSTMLSKTAGVRELAKDSPHPLLCVYRSSQAFGDVWKTAVVLSPHTPQVLSRPVLHVMSASLFLDAAQLGTPDFQLWASLWCLDQILPIRLHQCFVSREKC